MLCKKSILLNCSTHINKMRTTWGITFQRKQYKSKQRLDVDPRRDDDASPMSSYRCLLRPTWMISSLWHKSKCKSKFNFELKKKTSQTKYKSKFNFVFPCCSTREDLSIDVSITNVGLILTKLRWFQIIVTSQNSNFELFKKKSIFWVSML